MPVATVSHNRTSQISAGELLAMAVLRLRSAGIEEPVREAQLLVAHALGTTRLAVISATERILIESERQQCVRLIARRGERVPMAYLLRTQEFYGLEFEVTSDVLVPRPETELLVEIALEILKGNSHPLIVDVGTGSGCIAIAVARNLGGARVIATDISRRALAVARRNASRNMVADRIEFSLADFLEGIAEDSVDLIVSNPPYIPTEVIPTLQPEVGYYEPRGALDGGPDGLECYRQLGANIQRVLKPNGFVVVEVGAGQARDVAGIFKEAGLKLIEIRKDLSGIERAVLAQKQ